MRPAPSASATRRRPGTPRRRPERGPWPSWSGASTVAQVRIRHSFNLGAVQVLMRNPVGGVARERWPTPPSATRATASCGRSPLYLATGL